MRTLSLAPVENKSQFDSRCKGLITRAEQIKATADWQRVARLKHAPKLEAPTSRRKLTTREEIIILEGAKLNGFIFPPWKQPPTLVDFDKPFTYVQDLTWERWSVVSSDCLNRDSPDLHLSDCQREIFSGWKRPAELLRATNADHESRDASEPLMSVSDSSDLVQDVLTDCSVVASLCATTSRSERGLGNVSLGLLEHPPSPRIQSVDLGSMLHR